ncbi:SAC domain containing protein [Musa troglodytarum]|uniref:SAC domain containing protein n=1 Tax=Musa troglodytarum TaxID=320322 RepID=A0A9E7L930_9LILI|nr:SAC domain containing protein [Musa troglodytarum]
MGSVDQMVADSETAAAGTAQLPGAGASRSSGFTRLDRSQWRVLKIDRLEPSELNIREDPTTYSASECYDLLKRVHEGNISTGGLRFVTKCYGIAGFVKFLGPYYMLLITRRRKIGTILGHTIYAVSKSEMIALPNSAVQSSLVYSKDENRYKRLLCTVDLTKDFFFSYSYNIMRSLQKNLCDGKTGQVLYETMFVWNEFLTRGVRNHLKNTMWTVALVHGFFKQAKLSISGKDFRLTLIARRSRHFAGTRYLKRGVNEKGRVANDVETEQISREKKPRESLLRAEFANAIDFVNKDIPEERRLKFLHWDIQKHSRSSRGSTGEAISSYSNSLKDESTYVGTEQGHDNLVNEVQNGDNLAKSPRFQRGVLRTNCIDCLDRTNVAQYAYGLAALGHQLHALGFLDIPEVDLDSPLADDLMVFYERMGDTLALQYGGSAAHNKILRAFPTSTRSFIKRSLSDGNILRDSQTPVSGCDAGPSSSFFSTASKSTTRVKCHGSSLINSPPRNVSTENVTDGVIAEETSILSEQGPTTKEAEATDVAQSSNHGEFSDSFAHWVTHGGTLCY